LVVAAACSAAVNNFAAVGHAVAAGARGVVAPAHAARVWRRRQSQRSASGVAVDRWQLIVAGNVKGVAEEEARRTCERAAKMGAVGVLAHLIAVDEGNGGRVDAVQLPVVPKCCGSKHNGKQGSVRGGCVCDVVWSLERSCNTLKLRE
jgi:hypothetical protein